jgi:hypothetical protein
MCVVKTPKGSAVKVMVLCHAGFALPKDKDHRDMTGAKTLRLKIDYAVLPSISKQSTNTPMS